MDETTIKRFWDKVIKADGCWDWSGWKNIDGYGMFRFAGKDVSASRVSFYLANDVWPVVACHTCDNPSCTNPKHIFNGSYADNLNDCVSKGRHKFASRAACGRGHEYTGQSTLTVIASNGKPHRYCRTCKNLRARERLSLSRKGSIL